MHIPRTAGTAFGRFMEQQYPGARVFDFYAGATGNAADAVEEFRRKRHDEKQTYRLLKGHFVFGFDPEVANFRYVTLLRRPLERLISYYFYVLADSGNYLHRLLVQRRMRLEDFLLSDIGIELDNYQVRAISGVGGDVPRGQIGAGHLALAQHNLQERFAAFGLTERYRDSLVEMAPLFGWNTTGMSGEPPPGRPAHSLSDACRQEVAARNHYDLALYAFADRLFASRLAAS